MEFKSESPANSPVYTFVYINFFVIVAAVTRFLIVVSPLFGTNRSCE